MAKLIEIATLYDSLHKTPNNYHEEGLPMVRVTDVQRGYVNLSETKLVDVETFDEFTKKYKPSVGDMIFTRVGSYGNSCYIKYNADLCLGQNTVCISPDRDKVNPFYLYLCLNSPMVKAQIDALVGGASQPTISLKSINTLDIPYPKITVQHKIASILSTYDDLIENNLKRIKILEEMAQMIYREWFVNFRFPGHEKVKMVDSPLGKIPEGWEVKTLGDICIIVMGQSPKSEFYNENKIGLPFHQGVTDFGDRFPTSRIYCTIQNRLAEAGDILFSVRAPVGRINIANNRMIIGRGLCAIRSRTDNQSFVFQQLIDKFQETDTMGGGTIFKSVTKEDVHGIKVINPLNEVLFKFENIIKPVFSELEILTNKNTNLRKTRDLLLPKLISGELDVEGLDIKISEEVN